MELGYKLKKFREKKRLSQQEVADGLGVCQKTYSNYESCKTTPTLTHLIRLSKLLDFNILEELRDQCIDLAMSNDERTPLWDKNDKPVNIYIDRLLIRHLKEQLNDKNEIIYLLKDKIIQLENTK